MRVKRSWYLFLLLAGLGPLSLGALNSGSVPAVTVYYSERPPYSIVAGQTGILVDVAKFVLTEAGIRGRFIELPQERIPEVLRGAPDNALVVGWYRTAAREAWGRFSLPLYQEKPPVALISNRLGTSLGNPVRLDLLLASGLTLGVKAGSSLGPVLDQKVRAQGLVPLETAVDVPGLLKLVQSGRMDYTFLPEEEARYHLNRDPSLGTGLSVTRLTDPVAGNQRFFFFPDAFDPTLSARIDAAIEKVRASARYQELVNLP